MSILSDSEIIELCQGEAPMLSPFIPNQVRYRVNDDPSKNTVRIIDGLEVRDEKIISYGLSSYGYDVRIASDFYIFSNVNNSLVDPKNFDEDSYVRKEADHCIIPPNGFILARTIEYFKMPRDVSGLVLGKSTYARCGISCLATPIEAGWEGNLVLEFANTTPVPVKFYANEGAAQIVFFRGQPCITSYADRGGKYQGQRNITLPKV